MSLLRIETPRLELRPFTPEDAPAVVRLDADPDVMRFMKATQFSEAEMAQVIARYAARYDETGFGMLAGVLKSNGTLVGRYGLQRITIDDIDELGVTYSTRREHRRLGYAREAIEGILDAAWHEGVLRLVALVMPDNGPSLRFVERLGFRLERHVVFAEADWCLYAVDSPLLSGSST